MNPPPPGPRPVPPPDILEAALARVDAGEALDAVLAAYPEDREALEALVQTAHALRQTRAEPSPAFRAALQVMLVNVDLSLPPDDQVVPKPGEPMGSHLAARGTGGSTTAAPGPAPETLAKPLAGGSGRWSPWLRRMAASAVAVVIFLGGIVAVSADSRPGDLLYPVRRTAEAIGAALADAVDALIPGSGVGGDPAPLATSTAGSATSDEPFGAGSAPRRSGAAVDADTADQSAAASPTAQDNADAARATRTSSAPQRMKQATPTPGSLPGGRLMPSPTPSRAARPSAAPSSTAIDTPVGGAAPTAAPVAAPGGSIAGHVWGADRQPRAHWQVSAYPVTSPDAEPFGRTRFKTWTTEDGSYLLKNLPPGTYKVMAGTMWFIWGDVRWYPSLRSPKLATVVTVQPLATTSGIDIRYERNGLALPVRLP